MVSFFHFVLLFLLNLCQSSAALLEIRQNCPAAYQPCSPPGALNVVIPGPASGGLGGLYVDILDTVNPQPLMSLAPQTSSGPAKLARDSASTICCAAGTSCMLLQGFGVPMCYDTFTTDFFLPGGSYGTVSNGSYTTLDGDHINLITGIFKLANGQAGNLYNAVPNEKPNTSTLPIPTPFTSSGVGSAIPGSELGNLATYTTTIPGSYIPLTTVLPLTIPVITAQYGSAYTLANATVIPGYTSGGSSAPPVTITVTTTRPSITPPITAAGAEKDSKLSTPVLTFAIAVGLVMSMS